jgi:hypothetical protein
MFSSNSFNQGEPPTPTQTPTSATFDEKEFQTPKPESSFYDPRVTWNTADPYAASPNLLKTPRPYIFTPLLQRPPTASSENSPLPGKDIEAEIASHVERNSLPHSTAEPSNNVLSISEAVMAQLGQGGSKEATTLSDTEGALEITSSMNSAGSMQTPPPTSTSTTRRTGKKAQVAKNIRQSPATERRLSTPLFPAAAHLESSDMHKDTFVQQFPPLQFSPDVFDFQMTGPSTAPPYPQHKLFWESKNDEGMDVDFSANFPDLFGTPHQPALDPFVSDHLQTSESQVTNSTSFLEFQGDGAKVSSIVAATSGFEENAIFSTTGTLKKKVSRKSNANGVDPSLLFSSPSNSAAPMEVSGTATVVLDDEVLQPYAYQIQEAKRDKAFNGVEKPRKKRKPNSDSPAVKAALEALRGNNNEEDSVHENDMTDTVVLRTNKNASKDGRVSRVDARRAVSDRSRSKTMKHSYHKSRQLPHRRTSLALTIDSTGRARMEKRTILDDSGSLPEKDSMDDSEGSNSESSSEESNENNLSMSQAPNFSFSMDDHYPIKSHRYTQNSVSHSHKSSYASVQTSASFGEIGQSKSHHRFNASQHSIGSMQGGPSEWSRVPTSSQSSHSSSQSYVEGTLSDADTVMESDEGDGSAQHELRKLLQSRRSKATVRAKPKHHVHSPQTSQSFSEYSSTNGGSSHKAAAGRSIKTFPGISPSTISDPDLIFPSNGRSSYNAGNVRCVCHVTTSKGQMITWYAFVLS